MTLTRLAEARYFIDDDIRFYHNWQHAKNVMKSVEILSGDAEATLYAAAMYHDAVYIPGAGDDANELCSAAAFAVDIKKVTNPHFWTDTLIEAVQFLIRNTSIDMHLTHMRLVGDLAILLDADLSSLAVDDYDVFVANQHNIIRENGGEVNEENLKKCGTFLKQFLNVRQFIYHTEKARGLWEEKATENICRFLKY